jgi:hypothetical protein
MSTLQRHPLQSVPFDPTAERRSAPPPPESATGSRDSSTSLRTTLAERLGVRCCGTAFFSPTRPSPLNGTPTFQASPPG